MIKEKSLMQLKNKIIFIYILLGIIPCLLVGIGSYLVYSKNITAKVEVLVENNAQRDIQVISERLKDNKNILYNLVSDKELLNYVRKSDLPNEETAYKSRILERMQNYTTIFDDINSITFLKKNGEYILYDKKLDRMQTIWNDEIYRNYFYLSSYDKEELTYFPTIKISESNKEEIFSFFIAYPLKDRVSNEMFGIIVIGVDEKIFRYSDVENEQQKEFANRLGITSYIIDEKSQIISAEDKSSIGLKMKQLLKKKDIGENFKIHTEKIYGTPWKQVWIINKTILMEDVTAFTKLSIFILVVVLAVFLLITITFTDKLSRSISKIARYIGEYRPGETNQMQDFSEKDELYTIFNKFDEMRGKNEELIGELKHKNVEIREIADMQRKAELKALEAQINPHFLYNTLDSISWMAIENDEEEINQMLSTLGSLLRYSITNIDMLVPLEAELEWMKKYTFLQQRRFDGSFECYYDIQKETLAFPIYKMLLQPLIENIILHAFLEVKKGGLIQIEARLEEGEKLLIKIQDNGCGMGEDTLAKILRDIENKNPLNSESIGISNVVNRIHLYYKEETDIQVESKRGVGTTFILTIPRKEKSYENCCSGR